jgi:hypothetical protein
MKPAQRIAALLCLTLTACEPLVMIPGGELSGREQPVPASWDFATDVDTFQLETTPEDPYSVNVWGIAVGADFYVAGTSDRGWVERLSADPRVRLRVGENLYPLRAFPVADADSITRFVAEVKRKYDMDLDPAQQKDAVLFRLEAR